MLNIYITLKVEVAKAYSSVLGTAFGVTMVPEHTFRTNLFNAAEVTLHSPIIQYEPQNMPKGSTNHFFKLW